MQSSKNTSLEPIFSSQHGEDVVLAQIFNRRSGFFVEVGGYDGIRLSNSFFFEKAGWKGIIIEPIPELYDKIKKQRNCIIIQSAASDKKGDIDFYVSEGCEVLSTSSTRNSDLERINHAGGKIKKIVVQSVTLDKIFESNDVTNVDFISIDVEGAELSVLKGISLDKYCPKIIIVESNDVVYDTSVHTYLAENGFVRFKITGCNHWYCNKNDDLASFSNILYAKIINIYPTFKALIKTLLPTSLKRLIRRTRRV